jgi:hypothetical protein
MEVAFLQSVCTADRKNVIPEHAEVASSSAAKDSCKLQAVSFPSRHLCDFTKIATRMCLSNLSVEANGKLASVCSSARARELSFVAAVDSTDRSSRQ